MFWKCNAIGFVAMVASIGLWSGDVRAQCNGGGGSMPSGSPNALTPTSGYASSPLLGYSSNPLSGYSSSPLVSSYGPSVGLIAAHQQQVMNQFNSLAYENAQRQRLAEVARQEQARPFRLARAEAKRDAREARIAERLRQQELDLSPVSSGSYTLADARNK